MIANSELARTFESKNQLKIKTTHNRVMEMNAFGKEYY